MSHPLISVIIPTHKRSIFLKRAIQSINDQSNRVNIEVLVISDIKDTNTDLVCNEHLKVSDIYVQRNGQAGPSESRNLGLRLANGRYIMFLDDDDCWSEEFIAELEKNPQFEKNAVSYFNCNVIKETRPSTGPLIISEKFLDLANKLTEEVYVKNQIHMSCLLISKSLLNGLFFDVNMRAYEDWDFLLSVYSRIFPVHIPITVSNIHEVDDLTTDRRGSSPKANDYNAVIDYLYVYRRHPAPTKELLLKRKALLDSVNLDLPIGLL